MHTLKIAPIWVTCHKRVFKDKISVEGVASSFLLVYQLI